MFDLSRGYSITNQCDREATWASIAANKSIPNGCGSELPKFYFMVFLIVVSQIFLNLFVAIVIDSFAAQAKAFDLPIQPVDFENFVEVWKGYDPEATGFIEVGDLDQLLVELATNYPESNFFK